ncbi:hypothetical protein RhiirA1_440379 [Rhizophagus irregularis]|uniref:Uncharacterized protein n=1 Tax=Rhizophagus irregularis TaxID=588596 RepID=A0A2N0RZU5_9GLOM|nr:hypothetical protein RhiirA1_440379 [Rhizophagus irregularis]
MQRFYKSQEHRNYTKALNKIIPSNESKEKSARAQKCLDEFNIELPPRIVTSNSKVALVLDRDYENSEEIALDDDDGGLCKLRKTIINSFSKTFDSTAEDEFFQRMQFLFQHLAYTILLRSLKKKISERTLVANLISPILHTFFHNAYTSDNLSKHFQY